MKLPSGFDIGQPARRGGVRPRLWLLVTLLSLCATRLAWAEVPLPEDQPDGIVQQDEQKNAKPKAKPAPLPEDSQPVQCARHALNLARPQGIRER